MDFAVGTATGEGPLSTGGVETLAGAASGESLVVAAVEGDQGFKGKMISLGIIPGAPITLIEGGPDRPLLVEVPGGKFMLDAGSAGRIKVRNGIQGNGGGCER